MLRNQKGFTLIEIIAVLVILGILAAVAIPKYLNMQSDARVKAAQGALGALQSAATQDYAKGLLNGAYNATAGPTDNASANVGDFVGSYTTASGVTRITITSGPDKWNEGIGANNTKTFRMHD